MVRTLPYGPETGLNPARIAGIAVALLIHVAAFLLLLIPATLPSLMQRLAEPKAEVILIPKTPVVVPIQAPAPTVPQVSKVERRPMTPQAPTTPTPIAIDTPVLTEAAAEPAMPSNSTPTTQAGDIAPPSGPISASHLAYVNAPPPAYPRMAMRERAEGTVVLRVLVDVDGRPLEVVVESSSGNRELDRAARQQVLNSWRFQPAMQDGHAVQAYGRVPVNFSLR